MSKSDVNPNASVAILDSKDDIIRKFKRAVTDSDTVVRYADGKDGINNLMEIYGAITNRTMDEIEQEFAGKGYGDFKSAVGEAVAAELQPIQQRLQMLMGDKAQLESLMREGAENASRVAGRTLAKVQKKMGFVQMGK